MYYEGTNHTRIGKIVYKLDSHNIDEKGAGQTLKKVKTPGNPHHGKEFYSVCVTGRTTPLEATKMEGCNTYNEAEWTRRLS